MRGKAARSTAIYGGSPEIAGVSEDDFIAIDVGEAQKLGLRGGEGREKQKQEGGDLKPLCYARLNDDGTAFEPQRNVAGKTEALDGAGTIAADGSGNVYVLWHARGETPGEMFRRVYLAHSTDEGKTFGAESRVSSPLSGACSCCSMRALTDAGGRLFAAFRGAGTGVHRDSFLLVSPKPGSPFEEVKLGEWNVNYCPASSYGLAQSAAGVLVAWELKNQIYFAAFDPQSHQLSNPILVGGEGARRKYPVIVANARGEKLVAWTEGVSWSKGGSVAWQIYGADDQPIGARGEAPGVPPSSQATAFARPDRSFVVVF